MTFKSSVWNREAPGIISKRRASSYCSWPLQCPNHIVQHNDGISKTSLTDATPSAQSLPYTLFILSVFRRPSGLEDSSFRDLQRS